MATLANGTEGRGIDPARWADWPCRPTGSGAGSGDGPDVGAGVSEEACSMTTPRTTERHLHLAATGHDSFVDDLAPVHELDARSANGLTVALLWRRGDPGVIVRVDDDRTGVRFELAVPSADALDAFHHPFAYAG